MPEAPYPLEPDEHRRARHLFMLKRMAERAFDLTMKAADAAEAELEAPETEPEPPRAPDPHRTFQRYAALTRQLVAAEHRIATGANPARRPYRAAAPASPGSLDPRRAKIVPWIHLATRGAPDRAALHGEAETTLDEALASDPANETSMAAILAEICRTYGLPFDISKLPDEFLETATTGPPRLPQDEATRARIRQLAIRSASV